MSHIDELRSSLKAQLQELEQDATKLRSALVALNGSEPATRATKATPEVKRAPRRKGKPAEVAPEVIPAGKLEQILRDSEGLTTAEIAKQSNGDQKQILSLLKEMEGTRARRTGERRTTRWHAYTEEDEIQARAVELASRSENAKA
jgi:hypothetical protein